MPDKNDGCDGLRKRWKDFSAETSMHGLRNTSLRDANIIRRLIWLLMIAGVLVYLFGTTPVFIQDYIKRTVNTRVKIVRAAEVPFPTVTICNKNLWMRSVMTEAGSYLGKNNSYIIFDMLEEMYGAKGQTQGSVKVKYDWSSPVLAPMLNMTAEDLHLILLLASHSLEMTFKSCLWSKQPINCADVFTAFLTPQGYCYQFNKEDNYSVKAAGASNGLMILLDTVTSEYAAGPGAMAEGFSLLFHEKHEFPLVSELSIGVSPGTQTTIMLEKTTMIREPPPADDNKADCFDAENLPNPLKHFSNYSYSTCLTECQVMYVVNRCGCRGPLNAAVEKVKECSMKELLDCANPMNYNFTVEPDGLSSCKCNDSCVNTEYTAKLSTYKFPSSAYTFGKGYSDEEIEYMKNNFVYLDIFFGKMTYHKLEEYRALTEVELIASLGGTLGICIGASCLTIAEFLEFGLLMMSMFIKHLKQKMNNTPVEPMKLKMSARANEAKINSETHSAW